MPQGLRIRPPQHDLAEALELLTAPRVDEPVARKTRMGEHGGEVRYRRRPILSSMPTATPSTIAREPQVPAPPAASPRASPSRSPWIHGPWVDLALFVATPLLLVPLILARPGSPRIQELILYIGAFGALGHHLPGMLRAYGDRALFRRYRVRFIVAPLFLSAVCIYFTVNGLGGVLLVTFLWTTWHTLMQTYGFARIYDAKVGSLSSWTRWLDQALCIAWIGAPIFYSQSRFSSVLDLYYRCGGPLIPEAAITGFRTLWLAAAIAIAAVWLVHSGWSARSGTRPSAVKLALFVVSLGFWWFCMARVDHMMVGVALFDVFHDVQYLTLVWLFNRQRAAKDPGAGGFTRFLFRNSGALIGVYVGLVVGYGSLGYFTRGVDEGVIKEALLGLLAASALLHFYFDGFIWKLREPEVRAGLGVAGADARGVRAFAIPPWVRHGLKWGLFAAPIVLLASWQRGISMPERTWRESLLRAFPESAEAHTNLGVVLADAGELPRARQLYERAIELKPAHPESHYNLGVALRKDGARDGAEREFRQAIALLPNYALAHEQLANVLLERSALDEAEREYAAAIALDPSKPEPHANLGVCRLRRGDVAGSAVQFERALQCDPDHTGALNNLAVLRASGDASLRDPSRAVELAERLVRVAREPKPQIHETLAAAYASAGRIDEAVAAQRRALELAAGDPALVGRVQTRLVEYERTAGERPMGARQQPGAR
jgi:Flp pilus assembly protein TadD